MSPRFFIHQNYEPAKEETRGKKNKQNYEKSNFFAVDRRLRRHWHDILHQQKLLLRSAKGMGRVEF